MAYMVTRDRTPLAYVKDENAADVYVLKHQGMSVDWAKRYEGWAIAPAPEAPDSTTHHLLSVEGKGRTFMKCESCGKPRWELVADIKDENVTQYQCPKAKV